MKLKLLTLAALTLVSAHALDLAFTINSAPPEDKVEKYHVYVSHDTNKFYPMMTIKTNTAVYITNVRPGTYRYYIVAEDVEGGLSLPSEPIEIKPVPSRPILQAGANTPNFEQVATITPDPGNKMINFRMFYGRSRDRSGAISTNVADGVTNYIPTTVDGYFKNEVVVPTNGVMTIRKNEVPSIESSLTNQNPLTNAPGAVVVPTPVPFPPLPL